MWLLNLAEKTAHRSADTIYEELTSETVVFIIIINPCFVYSLVLFSQDAWQEVGMQDNLNGAGALHFKTLCKVLEDHHLLLATEGLSRTPTHYRTHNDFIKTA